MGVDPLRVPVVKPSETNCHIVRAAGCGLLLAAQVTLSCAAAPPLYRAIHPETGQAFKIPDDSRWSGRARTQPEEERTRPFPTTGYHFVRYASGTRVLAFTTEGQFRVELAFLESEDLLFLMEALQPNTHHRSLARTPDLFPLRVRVENTSLTAARVDLARVEVARFGGGAIACMQVEQYTNNFYAPSLFPLLFEWALDQKDEYHSLHPLPDYVLSAREARSPSRQEKQALLESAIRDAKRRHMERTVVAPLGSTEGICLFPLLISGRYEVRYRVAGNEKAPFSSFQFVVRLESDKDGARPLSGRPLAPLTEAADRFARERFESDQERRVRLRQDLYRMHRQHHEHDKLRGKVTEALRGSAGKAARKHAQGDTPKQGRSTPK